MNKADLLKLLDSDIDQNILCEQLHHIYLEQPDLFTESTFIQKRNIFHMLTIKQKSRAIESLLKVEALRALAFRADKSGQTILHLALKGEGENMSLLDVLTSHLPEMLNAQDMLGDTPLHMAVRYGKVTTVLSLLKNPRVNRSLTNHDGKTPAMLAETAEMAEALLYVDKVRIERLDLSFCESGSDLSEATLTESFPLLTARDSEGLTLDTLESSRSSASRTSSSSLSDSAEYSIEQSCNEDNLFKLLAQACETDPESKRSKQLLEHVKKLCQNTDLASHPGIKQTLACYPQLLSHILITLYPSIKLQLDSIEQKKSLILHELTGKLICHGMMSAFTPLKTPDFHSIFRDPEYTGEMAAAVWLTTAGQSDETHREYNLEELNYKALGLQHLLTWKGLLIYLRNMYPFFDPYQKMASNYMICQLINYNSIDNAIADPATCLQLKFFKKCNTKILRGLGPLGVELNRYINTLLYDTLSEFDSLLLKNYRLLNKWSCDTTFNIRRELFERMIDKALLKSSSARIEDINRLARDLRITTRMFYQTLSIDDYSPAARASLFKSQSDTASGETSSSYQSSSSELGTEQISELPQTIQTRYFNQLSHFITQKITGQAHENVSNALKFFIQLAKALYSSNTDDYPDLNHLMLLNGVFNNTEVSRLSAYFEQLSPNEKKLLEELQRLVSRQSNSKIMRELRLLNHHTLPYAGNILTDLTFAKDGNRDHIPNQAEAIGKVMLNVLKIKASVVGLPAAYHSNLPGFYNTAKAPDTEQTEELYYASLRLQLRKSDVFILPDEGGKLEQALILLQTEYLDKKIIPMIKYAPGEEAQPAGSLSNKLLECFSDWIATSGARSQELNANMQSTLEQLRISLRKLARLSTSLKHSSLKEQLNTAYYQKKINQFETTLSGVFLVPDTGEKLPKALIELNDLFLKYKIIPLCTTSSDDSSNPYPPNLLGIKLLDCFSQWITTTEPRSKEQTQHMKITLQQLKKTLSRIEKLTRYQSKPGQFEDISPDYTHQKLSQMKKALSASSTSQKESDKHSSRKRLGGFFGKNKVDTQKPPASSSSARP